MTPAARPPAVVRPATGADARAIAMVQVMSWRATYRGVVDDAYIDSLTVDGREERWRTILERSPAESHEIVVAETSERGVIAFASGGPLRDPSLSAEHDAELYAIYIMPDATGSGLGRTLVGTLVRALVARGHHGMLVQVLSGNVAARRFYEALGARLLGERPLTIGGKEYPESVYAWDELAPLGATRRP